MRFLSPASFWIPDYFCQSAWIEHAPFAFWICDILRPRCFVELGTHHGYSYFAFCHAIARLALGTAAHAVDTWQGDEHAGFYDENVFQAVVEQNTKKYAAFSRLIRSTFDDALQNFEDRSVDLLHIDGRHFYSDVKHDFENWRPKLTDNAIVLFHDTSVRERGFGVWPIFEELSATHPTFQFFHCHGLGVLAIGEVPDALAPLFESSDDDADQIRAVYAGLGGALSARRLQEMAEADLSLAEKNIRELGAHQRRLDGIIANKDTQLNERDARLADQDARLAEQSARLADQSAQIAEYLYHLDRINAWGWFRLGLFLDRLIRAPLRLVAKQRSNVIADERPDLLASEHTDPVLILPLDYQVSVAWPIPRVAVLLHVFYIDLLEEFEQALKNIPFPFALFISTDSEHKKTVIEQLFIGWRQGSLKVRVFANRGRDIAPKFVGFRDVYEDYAFVLHLHTKKSPHEDALKEWRTFLLDCLLGSQQSVAGIFEIFSQCPQVGIVAPRNFSAVRQCMGWSVNLGVCTELAKKMGATIGPESPIDFAAGSMFWARTSALKPLLNLDLTFNSFDEECGLNDGALAHAIERLTFYSCEIAGFTWVHAGFGQNLAPFEETFCISSPKDVERILPRLSVYQLAPKAPEARGGSGLSSACECGDLKARFRKQCAEELTAFFANDERIKLPTSDAPDASIILVLFNEAELTFKNLRSLALAIDVPAEVIIVDNASSDRTRELLARVEGAKIIQNSENLHFLRAVNQGAPKGRGKYILLLNNDTSLKAGPISIARDVLDENAKIGAVGGKIILLDGTLQEAGSIIWQDGVCLGYGRGRHPSEPEFQFRRDVDYCSGAFLMLRRYLFEQLGWLNEQFIPAYYEETDLCMRIRAAGYRVVYEPRVEVTHFEFGSSTSSDAALALQQRNHITFKKLHQKQLECGHLPSATPPLEARSRSTSQRILIIDDRVPYPELGAGYPRATEIIRAVHAAGWFISFYPLIFPDVSWKRAYRLLSRDIEIMADHGEYGLVPFLRERTGYYDAVLVSRPHNMESFLGACKQVPEFLKRTHLIYDAEAIFTAREALRVALKSRPFTENEYRDKLAEEIALVDDAKAIIAVSEQEASVFRNHCQSSVHVVGHRLNPKPTRRPFEARANILFVGALDGSQEVSPNVDGLVWFVHEVMPLLDKHLGDSYKLLVAGRVESDDVRALAGRRVEFLGVVPDLESLYDRARLFIAPTRFAAGIPHKVQEASAAGLPVVTTQLIAAQLNRSDLVDILTADTVAKFSEGCHRLYTDPTLWERIREGALERLACECDGSRFAKSVTAVLLDVPPLHRNA